MRKLILVAAALAVGAFGLDQTLAQQAQQQGSGQAAEEDMKVTGMVTEADQETKEITIEDEKFIMPEEGGGASLFPPGRRRGHALLPRGGRPEGDHAHWAGRAVGVFIAQAHLRNQGGAGLPRTSP